MRVTTENCVAGAIAVSALACILVVSCSRDTRVVQGPTVPGPTSTIVARSEATPRVVVHIQTLLGASSATGRFRPGDRVTVDYRVEKSDGASWRIDELPIGRALVSGPTFNYQRVIAEQTDVIARSQPNADGSFRYAFPPLPSTYLAPFNDTSAFGTLDGELAGAALLDGTYTVGLTFAWDYTVEGSGFRSSGETTADFLIGDTGSLAPRAVSNTANCNRCHVDMRVHDGLHGELTLCLLCHTSGAEDANIPTVANGTPGESIDARVLIHKLHNGAHLPSVLGIGFTPLGERDYTVPPRRYVTVDAAGEVHDFSNVRFPAWPNRSIPLPPSQGYNALNPAAKARDDAMRTGVTSCAACHGDPDEGGPIAAPTQGDVAYVQPTRRACNACHDTVDYSITTRINFQEMPPQADDSFCNQCHAAQGGVLGVRDVHVHPLLDTLAEPHEPFDEAFATGLNIDVLDLTEGAGGDADGTIDVGETLQVSFDLRDDVGAQILASTLSTLRIVVSGPTTNANLVLDVDVPRARFVGTPPYTSTLPERRLLEFVGDSSVSIGEVFTTAATPHWHVAGALTRVRVRVVTSVVASAMTSSASFPQNFVDVADSTGFVRDDYVVIDDGVLGLEEYLRVQFVEGNRLWFSSPASPSYASGLRSAHTLGAQVAVVTLVDKVAGIDYALDANAGTITELVEFGAGNAVVVDYVTDFRLPARYGQAANGTPDVDETAGKWAGKALVEGTYRLALSASFDKTHFGAGGQRVYTIGSPPAAREFLVGAASVLYPNATIASGAACNACHQELFFHGGRSRGFDNCIACHGNAGAEDRARYVAANAPATSGVTIDFRSLLHSIHRGSGLANAGTFTAVDASAAAYPNNFASETFTHVEFPAEPGGTQQCAKCHGEGSTSWQVPQMRDHPTEQTAPTRVWNEVCVACHDDAASLAHIATQTSSAGAEACNVCHGDGAAYSVELYHTARQR